MESQKRTYTALESFFDKRVTIDAVWQYGYPCLLVTEAQPKAAQDSGVDRLLYLMKQSVVILLRLHGELQPCMMDGPEKSLKEIERRMKVKSWLEYMTNCIKEDQPFWFKYGDKNEVINCNPRIDKVKIVGATLYIVDASFDINLIKSVAMEKEALMQSKGF